MSRYSVIFCAFFARAKIGDCSRKCRGHQTMTARWAARTTESPPQLSRANVIVLEQLSFSAALPCGRHYFSPHKMAAKNHRLLWHRRFKLDSALEYTNWRHVFGLAEHPSRPLFDQSLCESYTGILVLIRATKGTQRVWHANDLLWLSVRRQNAFEHLTRIFRFLVIQFRCGKRQDTISDKRGIHNTRLIIIVTYPQ